MTLGRSGQRAAGQHADADDADAGRLRMFEQPSMILSWIVCRQRGGRGRIEHIVHHLSAVEDARVDHLMQRRCVADCGEPKKTRLALLPQPLECRHDISEHLSDTERFTAAGFGDRIVQVEDIDPIEAKSRQTAFERLRHGLGNAAEFAARQPDLGADGHVGRFEPLQNAAEILFQFAVAVLHRGVEVVHAGGDRPRDGALLVEWIAAHHESADRAAAEAQH